MKEWVPLLDKALVAFARDTGKTRLHTRGRWGWKRFGDRLGWSLTGTDEQGLPMFEKEL